LYIDLIKFNIQTILRNMWRKKSIYAICIIIGILGGIIASASMAATDSPDSHPPAWYTPPPPPPLLPTPGPPPPEITPEPLENPISSEAEALEWIMYYDAAWSTHTEAWDADTLHREPDRIQVQAFDSRMEEMADSGLSGSFPPEAPVERGPVWRITIQGEVRVTMLGMGAPKNATYDGVTYVIAANTGYLLSIIPGKMIDRGEEWE
jgi:hypothetical protein